MHKPTILHDRYLKADIEHLPLLRFGGQIVVVDTQAEVAPALRALKRVQLVGIDTETKPTFHAGQHHKVALLQIATSRTAYLFRLCKIGLPQELLDWLQDGRQLKVGLSLKDDWHQLHERADFNPRHTLDLQQMVRRFGIEDLSLQKLCANILGGRISKREQLSNWEAPSLSPRQMLYAATDAWACLRLYQRLRHLETTRNFCLHSRIDTAGLIDNVIKTLLEDGATQNH